MWGKFAKLVGVLVIAMNGLPLGAAALTPCTGISILEVQARGVSDTVGDQTFVTVSNSNATSATVKLQYFRDDGIQVDGYTSPSFSVPALSAKTVVGGGLTAANPSLSSLGPMIIDGAGGALRLVRTTTGEPVCDSVGWGNESVVYKGAVAMSFSPGQTLARKLTATLTPQDTGSNADDFEVYQPGCASVGINEIQPFVMDISGNNIDAWLELVGQQNPRGDCVLVTAVGDSYTLPAIDLPALGEIALINRAIASDGQVVPLHLGEVTGQIWLVGLARYASTGPVHLPVITQQYTSLARGQSWALVDGIWRRTYRPTPESENVYVSTPTVTGDDPAACDAVRISELLPNPSGEDTGKEWLELHNESDAIVPLVHCQVVIAGTTYAFLPDDVLAPGEWRATGDFVDADGSYKALSLRNSGDTSVALQRIRADGQVEIIQSFLYGDAPDGQSWSRFEDGWRWVTGVSPNAENTIEGGSGSDAPTEGPAPTTTPSGDSGSTTYARVTVTELLPNPAAPATDDRDEFVEIYNPNDSIVELANYRLQVGDSYAYSYTFPERSLAPHQYAVITSGMSTLSLSNTSGRARIVDPSGVVLDESDAYSNAPEGQAWARINGVWQWTSAPTSGADNVFVPPLIKVSTTAAKAASGVSKATTAKPKSSTTTGTTKAAKTTKTAAPTSNTAAKTSATTNKTVSPLHPLVLATVGMIALLYAAYEYRTDIANRIYQFRRYRADRRANRSSTQGR